MAITPPASKAIILTGGTRGLGWEMAFVFGMAIWLTRSCENSH